MEQLYAGEGKKPKGGSQLAHPFFCLSFSLGLCFFLFRHPFPSWFHITFRELAGIHIPRNFRLCIYLYTAFFSRSSYSYTARVRVLYYIFTLACVNIISYRWGYFEREIRNGVNWSIDQLKRGVQTPAIEFFRLFIRQKEKTSIDGRVNDTALTSLKMREFDIHRSVCVCVCVCKHVNLLYTKCGN